jgi:2-keto-4-pentenoate hydratase/2-oxohepta-3-ene-1,7-dioic acid hydratase in catechol pathway
MKLVRYGAAGREKPGMIDGDGRIRDLSGVIPDLAGEALSPKSFAKLAKINPATLPPVRGNPRLGPCVGRVGNYIAIGLNYADHAAEAGLQVPKEPIIFNKAPTCVCGPNDDTVTPKNSGKLDYEVELAIVIGSRARYLSKSAAMDLGPWLVTKDEIANPQKLDMWLTVNGETRQKGSTKTMIFGVAHLVWYCSQFMVMEPGDVIATGTPPGVALGMKPEPKFLKIGDVVRLSIAGLGEQTQKVVRFKA